MAEKAPMGLSRGGSRERHEPVTKVILPHYVSEIVFAAEAPREIERIVSGAAD